MVQDGFSRSAPAAGAVTELVDNVHAASPIHGPDRHVHEGAATTKYLSSLGGPRNIKGLEVSVPLSVPGRSAISLRPARSGARMT